MKFKAVFLAGGVGTRLWPVSHSRQPKQISPLFGDQSILQRSYRLARKIFSAQDIYIVTSKTFAGVIQKQTGIRDRNIILEPERRETAAAIGLAAWHIGQTNPQAGLITLPSDHMISDEPEYIRTIKQAEKCLQRHPDQLLTIGINPTHPETGYGYIKLGPAFDAIGADTVYQSDGFKEKPSFKVAEKYFANWRYLWNSGMFVFRLDYLQQLYNQYLPQQHKVFQKIFSGPTAGYTRRCHQYFPGIKPISIDYAILEKLPKLLVLPAAFGWRDIGSWLAVADSLPKDAQLNVIRGQHVGLNSKGNIIYADSGKLVATIGLRDLVIIDTPEALLVCPKNRSQEVKDLVQAIRRKKLEKYL